MGKAEKQEKTNKKQKHFWKDFKAELKKVIWPTRSQVVNNTIIVLAIVIIVTATVFVLDLVFEAFNKYGIDKLKEFMQNSVGTEQTNTTENTQNNNDNTNTEAGNGEQDNGEENTEAGNSNDENKTPDDTTNE